MASLSQDSHCLSAIIASQARSITHHTLPKTLKAPGLSSRLTENRCCVVAKCTVQHRFCMLPYKDWLGVYTTRLGYKNGVMRDCQDRAVVVDGGTSDLFDVGEGVDEVVRIGVAGGVGESQNG